LARAQGSARQGIGGRSIGPGKLATLGAER
jgi:hypothetical protein